MNPQNEIRINVLDVLLILTKWKKTFLISTAIFVVVAVLLGLLAEKQYRATAIILPQEENMDLVSSYMKGMQSFRSQMKGNIFSPASDLENVLIAILKSRKLQLEVIQKFDLAAIYKLKKNNYFIEDVLNAFTLHVKWPISDEGMLFIEVLDSDPKRAANIANYITVVLNDIYMNLSVETARNRRIFLEERLKIIKTDLASCEDSFTQFQIKNGVIDLDKQSGVTVDAAAAVEARMLAAELNLNIAKKIYLPENQSIKEMELNFSELKKQRDYFVNNRHSDLLLPMKTVPKLGAQFIRLKRDLKIQEMLFELVIQQFEAAKLEEAKKTPQLQMLEQATPPQKREKPKRSLMVIFAFCASIVFNFVLINLLEIFKRMQLENTDNYRKIVLIASSIVARKNRK